MMRSRRSPGPLQTSDASRYDPGRAPSSLRRAGDPLRALVAGALALALASAPGVAVRALEVAGAEFPDAVELAPAGTMLVRNGAGIRRAFLFDVYAVALYLPARTHDAEEAIAAPGARRIAMQMLRDVDAEDFLDALETNLRANHDEATMRALAPKVERLAAIMAELQVARKGTRVVLDLVPGSGTVVSIDGAPRGTPIPGEDFFRALLRNWLGRHPISAELKRALLGAP